MNLGTAAAAAALGISAKRLDNILSRGSGALPSPAVQGRARQLRRDDIEKLALALLIERDLGVQLPRALHLADSLRHSADGELALGALGMLRFDLPRLRAVLETAIADAVEAVVTPARGRPRRAARPETKRGAP